jgi:CubicO group peptidase (beta-lactamase class C family)
VNFDSSPRLKALDELCAKMDGSGPGCALAVAREGKVLHLAGYGLANVKRKIPITSKTIFNIASNSKQFTVFSIHLLAQESKLSLEDDIRKYVPEIPAFKTPIRLRHLIHHTSGLRSVDELMYLSGIGLDYPASEGMRLIFRQKELNFDTGAEYLYNNTGYLLLAEVCQKTSGQAYRDFAAERIFKPLGMSSTLVRDDPRSPVANLAYGYGKNVDGKLGIYRNGSVHGKGVVGPTNVFSNLEDLLRWNENFRTGQVGGPKVLKAMETLGRLNDRKLLDCAGGLRVQDWDGLRVVFHGGFVPGYPSQLLRVPELDLSMVCLMNTTEHGDPTQILKDALEHFRTPKRKSKPGKSGKSPIPAKEISLSRETLGSYQGMYLKDDPNDNVFFVRYDGKALTLDSVNGYQVGLVPIREDVFRGKEGNWTACEFRFKKSGDKVLGFQEFWGSWAGNKYSPAESRWESSQFIGSYHCPEAEATLALVLKKGQLALLRPEYVWPWIPVRSEHQVFGKALDRAAFKFGEIEFHRDDSSRVASMTVHFKPSIRIRRLHFRKTSSSSLPAILSYTSRALTRLRWRLTGQI